jgi:hypothetical protein
MPRMHLDSQRVTILPFHLSGAFRLLNLGQTELVRCPESRPLLGDWISCCENSAETPLCCSSTTQCTGTNEPNLTHFTILKLLGFFFSANHFANPEIRSIGRSPDLSLTDPRLNIFVTHINERSLHGSFFHIIFGPRQLLFITSDHDCYHPRSHRSGST